MKFSDLMRLPDNDAHWQRTWVYVAKNDALKIYKVGISTDPHARLKAVYFRRRLGGFRLLVSFRRGWAFERALVNTLQPFRASSGKQREFFHARPAVTSLIRRLIVAHCPLASLAPGNQQ